MLLCFIVLSQVDTLEVTMIGRCLAFSRLRLTFGCLWEEAVFFVEFPVVQGVDF